MVEEGRGREVCGWHGSRGIEGERSVVGMVAEETGREVWGWFGSRVNSQTGNCAHIASW